MSEKHLIEFTRNKTEAKKIYFGKLFKKQILVYAIRLIGIIPISILFSIFFAVATQQVFNLGEKGTDWLMVLWSLLIVYPFINPIIKLYQQSKYMTKD
jgi:hypothetical protein